MWQDFEAHKWEKLLNLYPELSPLPENFSRQY